MSKLFFTIMVLMGLLPAQMGLAKPPPPKSPNGEFKAVPQPNTANLKENEFYIFLDGKYEKLQPKKYEGARFAPDCFKGGKPNCLAYAVYSNAKKNVANKSQQLPNSAAQFCIDQGAVNLIALGRDRNEFNFCRFSDKSMVNSWDLYFKYHPIEVVK